LQRLVGNRAVQRLIASAPAVGLEGGEAPPEVQASIEHARGSGYRLDAQTQAWAGEALGADLSRVRVHTDHAADQLNRALSASAFTTGSDVFFSQGAYNPGSSDGQKLLAHELTHVVQQGGGPGQPQAKLTVGAADDVYEQEAEAAAAQVQPRLAQAGGPPAEPLRETRAPLRRIQRNDDPLPVLGRHRGPRPDVRNLILDSLDAFAGRLRGYTSTPDNRAMFDDMLSVREFIRGQAASLVSPVDRRFRDAALLVCRILDVVINACPTDRDIEENRQRKAPARGEVNRIWGQILAIADAAGKEDDRDTGQLFRMHLDFNNMWTACEDAIPPKAYRL